MKMKIARRRRSREQDGNRRLENTSHGRKKLGRNWVPVTQRRMKSEFEMRGETPTE